jgi:F0F1-type ATP synthase assembly protein I
VKKNSEDNPWFMVGRYLALLSTLPAAIFVGYEIGAWLDGKFATHYLSIVFVLVGTAAGFVPIFHDLNKHD